MKKQLLNLLQETLSTDIPLTRHLGLSVSSYDNHCLTLSAPLLKNRNHKDTAFAGSLNAVVTLAGYSLLWLILHELKLEGKIVIQNSTIKYLKPVSHDFAARCCKPDPGELNRLITMLTKKGKARLELCAEIYEDDELAVFFRGRYVVHLTR